MADPFSIIGLVGVTLKSILQVKELIDTVQRSPRSMEPSETNSQLSQASFVN
jgi:hypothetical protein